MWGPVVTLSFSHLWTETLCDFVEPQRPLSPFSLCGVFAEFFSLCVCHPALAPVALLAKCFFIFFYFFALTQKVLYDSGWDAQGLPRRWLQADGMKKRNNKRVYVSLKDFPPVASLLFTVSGAGDVDVLLSAVLQRWTKPPRVLGVTKKEGIWVHLPAAKTPNFSRRHDRLWGLAPFSFGCRGPASRLSRFYSYTKLPWPSFTCRHSVIFLFLSKEELKKKKNPHISLKKTCVAFS